MTTRSLAVPQTHFVPVRLWAETNGVGINALYTYVRRETDPIPHIKRGRELLIDDELAVEWFRRNFGVGVDR